MFKSKKLLSLALALVMAFTLSLGALATSLPDSLYLVAPYAPETEITVTFIMEAADEYWEEEGAFYEEFEVKLESNVAQEWTVSDLLLEADELSADLTFFTQIYENGHYVLYPFEDQPDFLLGVEHDGVSFIPDTSWELWGWTFRVNSQYPLLDDDDPTFGYLGAGIADTPLKDGDVVHFIYEYPFIEFGDNYAANYVRVDAAVDVYDVDVTLTGARVYYDNNFDMVAEDFTPIEGTAVTLYNASGIAVDTDITDINGEVSLTAPGTGTYYVRSASASDFGGTDYDGFFLSQTTGYVKVVIN